MKKFIKISKLIKISTLTLTGIIIVMLLTIYAKSAIQQIAGLAVAQSNITWNNVIDAARGDSQTSGILGTSIYLWNGTNFDRVPGDKTNGMKVQGSVSLAGTVTPSDTYTNPTTAIDTFSLGGMYNGSTWDMIRGDTTDGLWMNIKNSIGLTATVTGGSTPSDTYTNPTTAIQSWSLNGMWNGSEWDMIRGDTTSGLWTNIKSSVGLSATVTGGITPADTFANPTTAVSTWSLSSIFNGTTWDRLRGDTTNGLWANIKSIYNAAADNSTNSSTKIPVLSGLANAANPSWTETNQVPLSVDLSGHLRTIGSATITTLPTTALTTLGSAIAVTGPVAGVSLSGFFKYHTWVITTTGSPTISTNLEGSIDSTNGTDGTWGVLDNSTASAGEMRHVAYKGVTYLRINVLTLSTGTVTVKSISGGN